MDIPASNGNGKCGNSTNCGTTKYDLGENSRRTNKARSNRPCKYFASGYLNLYDPVIDSSDLIKAIISEQETQTELTVEIPCTGDLVGDGLHGTDCNDVELMAVNVKSHQSSEKEQFPDCKDDKLEMLKDEEMTEWKDGSKVSNIEGDVKADEGEKIADEKSLRAFKFALAEFVKELLNPTWNERKIDRKAYKTIVKKVVRKVIFSESSHVPQTQESINNYLAASKLKISKLIQAYVEIVEKGKANVA